MPLVLRADLALDPFTRTGDDRLCVDPFLGNLFSDEPRYGHRFHPHLDLGEKPPQNGLDPELSGITEEKAVFHMRNPKNQRGVSTERMFRYGEMALQHGEITSVPGTALSGGLPDEGGLRLLRQREVGAHLHFQEGSPTKGD